MKFDYLLQQAVALGADYLATGHYARIQLRHPGESRGPEESGLDSGFRRNDGKEYLLKKAVDPAKDQSYVLYGLGQYELSRLMFPLGELTKTDVREIARRAGLRTADKPDSYEICFVPNEDYRQFISEEVPAEARPAGPIRHVDGRVLGEHRGLPFYTIGQREGLGLAVGSPLYVAGIDTATNTLVVGRKEDVLSETFVVREVSWVAGKGPHFPVSASVKIRSKHADAPAVLRAHPRGIQVAFDEPQSAITPGQAAVFYQGEVVLGGGVINNAL